jgi:hypothetical protein
VLRATLDAGEQPEGTRLALPTEDRLAIHELISLHGHLADEQRVDELDQLLTDDAVYDLDDFGMGQVVGLAAIRDLFGPSAVEQPAGHHVTNVLVTEHADGTVHVRSKGLSVMADGRAGTVVYDDVTVKTPAGWRIARRKVIARAQPGG